MTDLNVTRISIKYANAICLPHVNQGVYLNKGIAASLSAEMVQLGYMPTEELVRVFETLPEGIAASVYNDVITALRSMKGADVKYVPFYPNFPQQVMEASEAELFINAILHYWTMGEWRPEYEVLPREVAFEKVDFKKIGVIGDKEFYDIFTRLVSSNESLSASDKEVVEFFIDNFGREIAVPSEIPYKETMCIVAGKMIDAGYLNVGLVNTATDVLRIATYVSGGDVSLTENTKFKSLPRKIRRQLVKALEAVINEEDINRHRNKWIKLFHNLHVGEYSTYVNDIAKKVRENKKIETFNGHVQAAIDTKNTTVAVNLLVQRPGEYARRLDHLLRIAGSKGQEYIVQTFLDVIKEVPTRVLLQVRGALQVRTVPTSDRVVFPKGNVQRATILRDTLPALPKDVVDAITSEIDETLQDRFSELDVLGKVYIDPELKDCPVPTQVRSMSEGAFQVARGTRLPLGDKKTLRFFIYWVGRDIDLSATMHDENFENIGHVSYTKLRSAKYQSCHSGDITSAPCGASEFIDIDIDGAYEAGARYIAMSVLVFSGPSFAEHEKVYAGWMTRNRVQSNEIYDPKTVEQKIDLTADARNAIPVLFDLKERKAIWADMNTNTRSWFWGNNVESNRASIEQTLEALVDTSRKVSLYDLFTLHANVRGEIVDNKEDADIAFSLYDGDVTPYDISVINSEYVV